MTDRVAEILLKVTGDSGPAASQIINDLGRIGQTGEASFARLDRVTASVTRGLESLGNRYTALLSGVIGAKGAKDVIARDEELTMLGLKAGETAEEMAKFKQELFSLANDPSVRVDVDALMTGAGSFIEKVGDFAVARDFMDELAISARGTGAAFDDLGLTAAQMYEKFNIRDGETILRAFDVLNNQGDIGSVEFSDLGRVGPRISAAYASLRNEGLEGVTDMGAVFQVMSRGFANVEESSTAFSRTVSAIIENSAKLKTIAFGEDVAAQAAQDYRLLGDVIKDLLTATGADENKLRKIFGGEEMVIRGLRPFIKEFQDNDGVIKSLEKFNNVANDGVELARRAAIMGQTAAAAMQNLANIGERLANDVFSGPLANFAKELNEIDPDRLKEIGETALKVGAVLGTGIVFSKVSGKLSDVFGFGQRGISISGAGSGVLGGASRTNPVPVFVVNGGGFGGHGFGDGLEVGAPPWARTGDVVGPGAGKTPVDVLAGLRRIARQTRGFGMSMALATAAVEGLEMAFNGRDESAGDISQYFGKNAARLLGTYFGGLPGLLAAEVGIAAVEGLTEGISDRWFAYQNREEALSYLPWAQMPDWAVDYESKRREASVTDVYRDGVRDPSLGSDDYQRELALRLRVDTADGLLVYADQDPSGPTVYVEQGKQ